MTDKLQLPYDVEVFCPTCGNSIKIHVGSLKEGLNVQRCSLKNGGCDNPFVLNVVLELRVNAFEVLTPERELIKTLGLDKKEEVTE